MELNDRKNVTMAAKRKQHDFIIRRDLVNKAINRELSNLQQNEENPFDEPGNRDDLEEEEEDYENEDGNDSSDSDAIPLDDDFLGVDEGTEQEASMHDVKEAPEKVRMSKAERKRFKKQGSAPSQETAKAVPVVKKRKFVDTQHFITMQPSDDPAERE